MVLNSRAAQGDLELLTLLLGSQAGTTMPADAMLGMESGFPMCRASGL